jgi:TonB family protein
MVRKLILVSVAAVVGAIALMARADDVTLPSLAQVEQVALKHPTPEYPKKARAKRVTGAGLFAIQVDGPTGQVIDVTVDRSTGSALLDQSAVEALRRWLFRPNSVFGYEYQSHSHSTKRPSEMAKRSRSSHRRRDIPLTHKADVRQVAVSC